MVFGGIEGIDAYRGFDDEASHAFKGPTTRSKIMFGRSRGIHLCVYYFV
ncbi:DNA-3-methyladenine glycosylase [Candidatus Midichloria mitochondrii]